MVKIVEAKSKPVETTDDTKFRAIENFLTGLGINVTAASSYETPPVIQRTVYELKLEGDYLSTPASRHSLRKTFEAIAKNAGLDATVERQKKGENHLIAHIYL